MSTPAFSKWLTLACIAIPTGAVVVARSVLPAAGPRGASAATPKPAKQTRESREDTPSPLVRLDTTKVLEEIDKLRETPVGDSPFVSRVPRALTKIVMTTPETARKPLPEFSLSSIAGGTRQSFAIIDGKVRRVGDDLGDGWIVSGIDAANGEVTVLGPDDVSISLDLRPNR